MPTDRQGSNIAPHPPSLIQPLQASHSAATGQSQGGVTAAVSPWDQPQEQAPLLLLPLPTLPVKDRVQGSGIFGLAAASQLSSFPPSPHPQQPAQSRGVGEGQAPSEPDLMERLCVQALVSYKCRGLYGLLMRLGFTPWQATAVSFYWNVGVGRQFWFGYAANHESRMQGSHMNSSL